MIKAVITADILSVVFLSVIIWAMLSRMGERSRTTKLFVLSVAAILFTTAMDAVSYLVEGTKIPDAAAILINIIAIGGCDISLVPFLFYTFSKIAEKSRISIALVHLITFGCAVDFSVITATSFSGILFSVENGATAPSPFYNITVLTQILLLTLFILLVLINRRHIGKDAATMIGMYSAFPAAALFIMIWTDGVSFVYPALSLVALIVYILLQSEEMEKGHIREQVMFEYSNTDALTSLRNRRAYEISLSESSGLPTVGVLFCDINGLKYENDTFGHAAGDALIIRFANLLKQYYCHSEIFRISGDEFVILTAVNDRSAFIGHAEEVMQHIAQEDRIASVGYAFGMGNQINALVHEAESRMYADKIRYYQETGRKPRNEQLSEHMNLSISKD